MFKRVFTLLTAVLAFALAPIAAAHAESKREKAEILVQRAAETAAYFSEDSAFSGLRGTTEQAKAMVIIPRSIRAGFLLAGAAGNAVMIARTENGGWSQPVFLTVGSVSFGFQAGAEASEVVLLVMTQRGMEHLLSTTVKLGGDVSLAAGPVGAGAKAQTADILSYSRQRGLYGGVSLEGAILKTRGDWNSAYYNAPVSPADVIYRNNAYNARSAALQQAVASLAGQSAPRLAPAQSVGPAPTTTPGQQPAPKYEDDAVWGERVPTQSAPPSQPQ